MMESLEYQTPKKCLEPSGEIPARIFGAVRIGIAGGGGWMLERTTEAIPRGFSKEIAGG